MSEESVETPKQPPIPAPDTARKITPIRMMTRGEDSIDSENQVVFSDFSPKILPADFPDEEVTVPKDAFAQAPAASGDLAPSSALTSSGTSAPPPPTSLPAVPTGDGKPSPSASSSPPSSSAPKSG